MYDNLTEQKLLEESTIFATSVCFIKSSKSMDISSLPVPLLMKKSYAPFSHIK